RRPARPGPAGRSGGSAIPAGRQHGVEVGEAVRGPPQTHRERATRTAARHLRRQRRDRQQGRYAGPGHGSALRRSGWGHGWTASAMTGRPSAARRRVSAADPPPTAPPARTTTTVTTTPVATHPAGVAPSTCAANVVH